MNANEKIRLCEEFLEAYAHYIPLSPEDFLDQGYLPQMVYRAKIAFVLQFLKQLGIQRDEIIPNLNEVSAEPENEEFDHSYPDWDTFESFMSVSPYHHVHPMNETMDNFIDIVYGNFTPEDENKADDEKETYLAEGILHDLTGNHNRKIKETAGWILNDLGYEGNEVFFYEEWDELIPYYLRKCCILTTEKGFTRYKPVSESQTEKKLLSLYYDAKPVMAEYCAYNVSKEVFPESINIYTFGFSSESWGTDYSCTRTNFVYGIQVALIHLYLFLLDQTLDFLPKKYKGKDKLIFPKIN